VDECKPLVAGTRTVAATHVDPAQVEKWQLEYEVVRCRFPLSNPRSKRLE